MTNRTRTARRSWLAAVLALPLAAAAASGEFTFVTGQVTLAKADGRQLAPLRGTPVDAGDRITTGPNGMVQLTMVDQARLSLRPSTQFVIEQYSDRAGDGVVLSLIKGTLRTFTGLLAAGNRDKFVMKTRVATVGIRGSGNILYACEAEECDASVVQGGRAEGGIAVNHTIEGSHAVSNAAAGAQTLITGPGQTVLVMGAQAPRYIPTPRFITDAATNMVNAKPGQASAPGSAAADTRDFAPSDASGLGTRIVTTALVGNNGLGFTTLDATANLAGDPLDLRDIIIAGGSPVAGQAVGRDLVLNGDALRGYRAYAGTQSNIEPALAGGSSDLRIINLDGTTVTMGRYEGASLGFFGTGSLSNVPGSVHWIMAPSGYPVYLSDVLTGTATYTLAAATPPTNQNNVAGTLGSARIDVNFSDRTLGLAATVSIPSQGANNGGTWQMNAANVPISLNAFFGSTADRLIIVNGSGISSRTNGNLSGSFEGSFVGTGLTGAILGYGISDATAPNAAFWNFVSGVAALAGPRQLAAAPYREGRVSDPSGQAPGVILTYAATNRLDEVTADAQGRVTRFTAPRTALGGYAAYELGSAQVVQSGVDAETGMVWGRWGGGTATATRGSAGESISLANTSLHYIFAGPQSGPVALPLTGTATYDVIGSTSPTDSAGHVGALNSATLNANFSNRTVDASVNVGINGQTWTGSAHGMPIYRDQYFSAYSGNIPGLPNPTPLIIGCEPSCGQGAAGSFDGFFSGRSGQRAGLMFRLGPNQGAIAFGRRGG
ncbi:MAG TPA: FecR domain-containing protein [Usitatibacter sp.]|nr:FecR domain-containing protein [Usitatibacter sp.]